MLNFFPKIRSSFHWWHVDIDRKTLVCCDTRILFFFSRVKAFSIFSLGGPDTIAVSRRCVIAKEVIS